MDVIHSRTDGGEVLQRNLWVAASDDSRRKWVAGKFHGKSGRIHGDSEACYGKRQDVVRREVKKEVNLIGLKQHLT